MNNYSLHGRVYNGATICNVVIDVYKKEGNIAVLYSPLTSTDAQHIPYMKNANSQSFAPFEVNQIPNHSCLRAGTLQMGRFIQLKLTDIKKISEEDVEEELRPAFILSLSTLNDLAYRNIKIYNTSMIKADNEGLQFMTLWHLSSPISLIQAIWNGEPAIIKFDLSSDRNVSGLLNQSTIKLVGNNQQCSIFLKWIIRNNYKKLLQTGDLQYSANKKSVLLTNNFINQFNHGSNHSNPDQGSRLGAYVSFSGALCLQKANNDSLSYQTAYFSNVSHEHNISPTINASIYEYDGMPTYFKLQEKEENLSLI